MDERRAAREAEQRALTEFSKLESYWLARYRVADAIELRFGDDFIERTRRHLLKVESESEIDFLLLHLPRRDEFLSYYHGKYTDVGSPEFDNKLFPAQYPAKTAAAAKSLIGYLLGPEKELGFVSEFPRDVGKSLIVKEASAREGKACYYHFVTSVRFDENPTPTV